MNKNEGQNTDCYCRENIGGGGGYWPRHYHRPRKPTQNWIKILLDGHCPKISFDSTSTLILFICILKIEGKNFMKNLSIMYGFSLNVVCL